MTGMAHLSASRPRIHPEPLTRSPVGSARTQRLDNAARWCNDLSRSSRWRLGNRNLAARSPIHSKEEDMAIIAMFEVNGSTAAKYDEVVRRLTKIDLRIPDG